MFFEKLKSLCAINGTSLSAVVVELGMSKGSVTNWKNGTMPNADVVIRLANHFNVSTDYLLLDSTNSKAIATHEGVLLEYKSMSEDEKEQFDKKFISIYLEKQNNK